MNGDRKRADVAVVGGGVIGAAAALELARRGASVVLLERGGDLAWGCSAGNAGIVGPGHVQPLANPAAVVDGIRWMGRPDSPFFVRPRPGVVPWLTRFLAAAAPSRVQHSTSVLQRLAVRSAELHAELHAGGLDAGYQQRGLLDVFRGEKAFRAAVGAVGPGDEVVRVEDLPGQLGPGFAGGVLRRGEAHCDPLRFVLALGAWAAEVGVEIRTGVEVLGLRRTGRRVDALWTTEGDVEVAEVVVAAGVWSAGLAGELGLRLPIEGGKGYHVDIEARPGDPELPIWLHEHRVVVTPNGPRIRLAGTMELTGTDRGVDQRRVDAITRAATEALPGFAGRPPLHVWRGLRPCTPDGLPIIGRAPAL
ncbi:MAG TPA: FAD-dependent oxidoreductase, partial [Solirubrobacter sp.]|nr:FAD-dependent oxidoreductase [Solirubrobacter sp.]